jgi:GTP cyclohydrolase I
MIMTKETRMRQELQDILARAGSSPFRPNYYTTKKRLIAFFNRIAREYDHDTRIVEHKINEKSIRDDFRALYTEKE